MASDWEWMFAGESGRDRILRGEIEGLQASAYSARAQSARLTSQLTQLQGSLETRLSALSAAFDAYVELGDVREQLAGYPDTSAIRRDAVAAIDTLSRGGRPEPLDHRDLDYWLSYAVNAVIASVADAPDGAAEQRAHELSPDAELFIVAAAGALGAGPAVGARVPALLVCDGTLAERQLVLWRAVVDGVYGDVLAAVGEVWRGGLDQDADNWAGWIRDHSRMSTPFEALTWLDQQTSALDAGPGSDRPAGAKVPTHAAPPVPADQLTLSSTGPNSSNPTSPTTDSRAGLRSVVINLVGQGTGSEAALLARARTLRAKIEDPTGPDPALVAAEPGPSLTEQVQTTLLSTAPGSAVHRELLSWVQPGLAAATAAFAESAAVVLPADVTLRTDVGLIKVSESGVEPQRLHQAEAALVANHTSPLSQLVVPGGIAVGVALLALWAALTDHPRGAQLLLLVAVIAAGVALNALRLRRREQPRLKQEVAQLHTQVAAAQQQAQAARQSRQEIALDASTMAATIAARLASLGRGSDRQTAAT